MLYDRAPEITVLLYEDETFKSGNLYRVNKNRLYKKNWNTESDSLIDQSQLSDHPNRLKKYHDVIKIDKIFEYKSDDSYYEENTTKIVSLKVFLDNTYRDSEELKINLIDLRKLLDKKIITLLDDPKEYNKISLRN